MPRVIGFTRESPASEYVIFTDEETDADDFKKEGYELNFDEEIDELPSSFPTERNLVVEM